MTAIIANAAVLGDIASATAEVRKGLRVRKHESGGLYLVSTNREADQFVRAAIEKHGERFWFNGRWHIKRYQMRLPGM